MKHRADQVQWLLLLTTLIKVSLLHFYYLALNRICKYENNEIFAKCFILGLHETTVRAIYCLLDLSLLLKRINKGDASRF